MAVIHQAPAVTAAFYQPLFDGVAQVAATIISAAFQHPALFALEVVFLLCMLVFGLDWLQASASRSKEDVEKMKRSEFRAHISHLAASVVFAAMTKNFFSLITSLVLIVMSFAAHNLAHAHAHEQQPKIERSSV